MPADDDVAANNALQTTEALYMVYLVDGSMTAHNPSGLETATAYLCGPFPAVWRTAWMSLVAVNTHGPQSGVPRYLPVLWNQWRAPGGSRGPLPNPCSWTFLTTAVEDTLAGVGRAARAPHLGPRHTAADVDALSGVEAHHRAQIETEWRLDGQAWWFLFGIAHLCDVLATATPGPWAGPRDACLRALSNHDNAGPRASRESSFRAARAVAEQQAIQASWQLSAAEAHNLLPLLDRTTLRGSKTGVLVGMLSCAVRDLLTECAVFLEGASRPAFMAVLHGNEAAPHIKLNALAETERRVRAAIEDAALRTRRVQGAVARADAVFAHRWHCYVNELERTHGTDHFTLFEQAEIEKTFLWMRVCILRSQNRTSQPARVRVCVDEKQKKKG